MTKPKDNDTVPSVDSFVLLPCPFCGSEPEISESDSGEPRWVWCPVCEADGPPIDYRFKGSKAKARRIVVDAWNRRDGLGSEYTDSSWLRSVGFIKDATSDNYRMKNWLVLKCEAGKWQAYSVKSSHWHYLCDVDRRGDVTSLVNALKLNA